MSARVVGPLAAAALALAAGAAQAQAPAPAAAESPCQRYVLSANYSARIASLHEEVLKEPSVTADLKQKLDGEYAVIKQRNDAVARETHPLCAKLRDHATAAATLEADWKSLSELVAAMERDIAAIRTQGCPFNNSTLSKEQWARCEPIESAYNAKYGNLYPPKRADLDKRTAAHRERTQALQQEGSAYIAELSPLVTTFINDATAALATDKVRAALRQLDQLIGQLPR
ncbi:MAG: hypothetical protein HY216_17970 [Candidatus Rokubacteria bacterium]|nr:hypothetical protein [Candidatus Rokubacteria bacterium]